MSPSPNHGDRRGQRPELVVIHYTGMADGASARARLCDPGAEVSAHWLIHEDGRSEALVPEDRRAWHAGAGSWQGRDDVNSRSIGIELVNPGDCPFPEPQMAALEALLGQIMARWDISPAAVDAFVAKEGGRKAASIAALAAESDVICSMVPDAPDVKRAALAPKVARKSTSLWKAGSSLPGVGLLETSARS